MSFNERKECVDEMKSTFDDVEEYGLSGLKTTISNYSEEMLDYQASKFSGYVYSVSIYAEQCFIYSDENNGTEEEDCGYFDEENMLWAKVGGKWGYGESRDNSGPGFL